MTSIRRILKLCALLGLGVAVSGCIVLPYGAGRGHYERGGRYNAPHGDTSRHHQNSDATPERRYGPGR